MNLIHSPESQVSLKAVYEMPSKNMTVYYKMLLVCFFFVCLFFSFYGPTLGIWKFPG